MIAHAFMTTLFLLSFQIIAFLLNAPLLGYNIKKCVPSFPSFLLSPLDDLHLPSYLLPKLIPLPLAGL